MRIPNIFPLLLLAFSLSVSAQNAPCLISDLVVEVGPCTSNSTYQVEVDFNVQNPTSNEFDLWGNNVFIGTYQLSDLPVTLNNFPNNGLVGGFVKVCLKANAPNAPPCCAIKQFVAPDCAQTSPCEITDIKVETGDCLPNGAYKIKLDFKVVGATNALFGVWAANGQYLGNFPLSQLPVSLTFPGSGGTTDKIKICINDNPNCCRYHEFQAPACPPPTPCTINDLRVETGKCTSDSTYELTLKFSTPATSLADSFSVYAANGQLLGRFAYADLPVTISDFPWGGNNVDAVKICLSNTCCRTKEFNVPDCIATPCGIGAMAVEVGDCIDLKKYRIKLNFDVALPNPGADVKFGVWAGNGNFLGTYGIGDLPLAINFPRSGDPVDALKVCLLNADGDKICCKIVEFKAPDCNTGPCPISDLKVEVGPCNNDGTYSIAINFKNSSNVPGAFGVWDGSGKLLGIFPLSALPIKIAKFPASGNDVDKVRVCLITANAPTTIAPTCCLTVEFKAPDCSNAPCGIFDLKVETGPCNNNGTYSIVINFGTLTANGQFGVWAANGQYLGLFPFSALPLTISNFPASGKDVDAVKVCVFATSGAAPTCCLTKEFKAPDCAQTGCEIADLKVEAGPCNNDGTFKATVNFKVHNAGTSGHFVLWINGAVQGTYPLSALPLSIPNFPGGNGAKAVIKVCVVSAATNIPSTTCCKELEFATPHCSGQPCTIADLKVDVGPCNNDGTYKVVVNFTALSGAPANAAQVFGIWANGTFLGAHPLTALPYTIPNFPAGNGAKDVVKVCLLVPGSTQALCCESIEFQRPNCQNTPCTITNLKVETGPCNNDGTYKAVINFNVNTPVNIAQFFGIWANGHFLGSFPISALPFTIPNFPTDGGPNDVVKVCLVTPNATQPLCCETLEFPVPDCLNKPCKIWDAQVQATPCLCGQFFAVLTFRHQNGGSGGFDIVGANGDVYGNYPYNQQQPIILGPLDGDNLTEYGFIVQDHLHPDCHDAVKLGLVDCTDDFQPGGGNTTTKIAVSPNPATNWLLVTTQSPSGAVLGQATAEVRKSDGRLMRTVVVPNGNNFQMDVSELPAGIYRLSVQTAEARMESMFVKQ